MARPSLEVADIFRDHGAAWRDANRGHVSLGQLKVMSAIENCRTAALGGHVARCENSDCGHTTIAYNSCRNRHCPKCQGAAARDWMAAREAELLPAPYFHIVFTLPAAIADIAYQNKAVIYDLLFKASSETMLRIAADPKHLGARIGITAVLHTWGSAMTHHPHVHMIVPGGGLSFDRSRWIAAKPLYDACINILTVTKGAVYMCMSSSELDTLQTAFREAGGKWSTFVIWAKNTFTLGRSDYQRQYEPILYGWKQGADHYWCGDRDQGDVWFFDKPAKNDLHPTMKPVALVERAIRNSSKSRDIVFDPFGGSGTTLIAAERTGRRARLIELDPKYVDVIVERWQASTGGEARLAQTNLPFRTSDTTQYRMRRNGDKNSRGICRPIDQSQE